MKKIITIIILTFGFFGCSDHYNDMVQWTAEIPIGSGPEEVKQSQPGYLTIAWDNPDTIPKQLRQDSLFTEVMYDIIKIMGNYDILKMQNSLVFIDGRYAGRKARK